MSLWKRLFGNKDDETESDDAEAAPESPDDAAATFEKDRRAAAEERAKESEAKQLERLRRIGRGGGADVAEAISLLRQHTGSSRQTRVLSAILEGLTDDPALDPARVACARLLEERGDREQAKAILAPTRSVSGMMLGADMHAATGNLARAVSVIERVLARDIDTPGARERHERWCGQLGRDLEREQLDDSATVVAPHEKATAFRLIREVARGGAGTIYEAEDELLGRRVAFKVYHRADQDHEQIEREAQTAVHLAGPGVIRIYDADPSQGWLATEWIPQGALREMLKTGRVAELFPLARWLPRLIDALGRIHDSGLVHADVKPANVLFRGADDPVLADFGVCVRAGSPGVGGTPGYMSPERLAGGATSPSDDVYAIGRIIEDVLGARDDAEASDTWRTSSEAEARHYAKVALSCMSELADRPRDAMVVAQHLGEVDEPPEVEPASERR